MTFPPIAHRRSCSRASPLASRMGVTGTPAPVIGHEGAGRPTVSPITAETSCQCAVLRRRHEQSIGAEAHHDVEARHSRTCTDCRSATTARAATSCRSAAWRIACRRPESVDAGDERPADLRPERNTGAQARSEVKLLGKVLFKDGSVAQHTINVTIRGKPYVIFVDEGGSGGITSPAQLAAACAAGMPPFPMARIIDICDETNPKIVSRVMMEVHDPANCSAVLPDLVGPVELHVRQPLLQRRQPEERDHARVRLLQLRHPRLRHPRPAAAEGNRLLQSGRHHRPQQGLESHAGQQLGSGRARLVFRASAPRQEKRHTLDDVPGQRAAHAEVHQRRLAAPGKQYPSGTTELAKPRGSVEKRPGFAPRVFFVFDLRRIYFADQSPRLREQADRRRKTSSLHRVDLGGGIP